MEEFLTSRRPVLHHSLAHDSYESCLGVARGISNEFYSLGYFRNAHFSWVKRLCNMHGSHCVEITYPAVQFVCQCEWTKFGVHFPPRKLTQQMCRQIILFVATRRHSHKISMHVCHSSRLRCNGGVGNLKLVETHIAICERQACTSLACVCASARLDVRRMITIFHWPCGDDGNNCASTTIKSLLLWLVFMPSRRPIDGKIKFNAH